jgi:glycerol kinase
MAFTLNFCLDYMNSSSDIILDGPLTKNNIIMGIVATLRSKQKVFSNKKQIGTSLGASLLFNIKKKSKLNLNKISILENTNYKKLYKIWIDEIKNKNLLN